MNIIAFAGDTHGQIDRMYELLLIWQERTGTKISAIVQVGDFGIFLDPAIGSDFLKYWNGEKDAPIPTYVCPGNHESMPAIGDWEAVPDRMPNLRLLPDGGVTVICGKAIGSVWGNYSPKSWNDPRRVQQSRAAVRPGRCALHIYRPAVERLLAHSRVDILVSHDAASCDMPPQFRVPIAEGLKPQLGLDADENSYGCPGLMMAIDRFQPERHYFGHFHVRWEGKVHRTQAICLPDVASSPERFADFFEVQV